MPGVYYAEETPTLEEAQKIVGGYVQALYLEHGVLLFDEDGLSKELKINEAATALAGQPIVGDALFIKNSLRGGSW